MVAAASLWAAFGWAGWAAQWLVVTVGSKPHITEINTATGEIIRDLHMYRLTARRQVRALLAISSWIPASRRPSEEFLRAVAATGVGP